MSAFKKAAATALKIEEESSEADEPLVGRSKLTHISLFKDASPKFLSSTGTALRVSCWVTVYAIIVMFQGRQKLTDYGFDSATVLCNVLFTVGADLGSTINNVFYGVIGSFWAWLVFWVMFGIWPDGYVGNGNDDHVWYIGMFIIALYTLVFLVLKVDGNIRFWALLNFTGTFAMKFVNPEVNHTAVASSFALNWKGAATNTTLLYCAGAVLALLIFLIPFYTALKKSQKAVTEALVSLIDVQDKVIRYYCGSVATLQLNNYLVHFRDAKSCVDDALSEGGLSWFESLGMSSSRAFTNFFAGVLGNNVEIYKTALQVVKTEDFTATHTKMMRSIAEPLKALQQATHELLRLMHSAAMDGSLDDSEQRDLEEHCEAMPQRIVHLQQALEAAAKQFGPEPVNSSVLGEYYFAFTQCRMAIAATEAAQDMDNVQPENNWGAIMKTTVMGMFAVERDDVKWALRSFLAIMINFYLGYLGWCDVDAVGDWKKEISSSDPDDRLQIVGQSPPSCFIHPYTSGLANINIVLLSRYMAAAPKAGLDRCSAVVLANVVGHMGFVALGWCTLASKIWTVVAVFFVCEAFMYVNYQGGSFAAIGQRLAAMTVYSIMVPCSDEANTQHTYSASYHGIAEIIIGVLLMTIIDVVFGDKPSAEVAAETQLEVIDDFQEAFKEYIYDSANAEETKAAVEKMEGKLKAAATASADAVFQPSFWRRPWNAEFFQSINSQYSDLCAHLKNLTLAVGDRKKVLFVPLQTYHLVQQELAECVDFTTDIAKAALQHEDKQIDDYMTRGTQAPELQVKMQLIDEMNKATSVEQYHSRDLQGSSLSHRCVTVSEMDALVHGMLSVQAHAAKAFSAS